MSDLREYSIHTTRLYTELQTTMEGIYCRKNGPPRLSQSKPLSQPSTTCLINPYETVQSVHSRLYVTMALDPSDSWVDNIICDISHLQQATSLAYHSRCATLLTQPILRPAYISLTPVHVHCLINTHTPSLLVTPLSLRFIYQWLRISGSTAPPLVPYQTFLRLSTLLRSGHSCRCSIKAHAVHHRLCS